jgi:hypothetical protein
MYNFQNNTIYILLQFNALKHQLKTQRYEPSTTAHVVRKLLTAVVTFGTTIPNRPSSITSFGCFRCLDSRINDLVLNINSFTHILSPDKVQMDKQIPHTYIT